MEHPDQAAPGHAEAASSQPGQHVHMEHRTSTPALVNTGESCNTLIPADGSPQPDHLQCAQLLSSHGAFLPMGCESQLLAHTTSALADACI